MAILIFRMVEACRVFLLFPLSLGCHKGSLLLVGHSELDNMAVVVVEAVVFLDHSVSSVAALVNLHTTSSLFKAKQWALPVPGTKLLVPGL